MIGVASTACAITIAVGVNSSSRKPSGPERERARYRPSPTTTGGSPKNALIRTSISRRPRKAMVARAHPAGKLIAVAKAVAARLTPSERPTIWRSSCNFGTDGAEEGTALYCLGAARQIRARSSDPVLSLSPVCYFPVFSGPRAEQAFGVKQKESGFILAPGLRERSIHALCYWRGHR